MVPEPLRGRYAAAATIFNDPTQPHAYTGTNAMLRELDPAVLHAAMELTGPGAPVMCVVQLRYLGGALARPPAVPGAVAHRDAGYLLHVLSLVDGTDVPGHLHRQLMDTLAPWTLGRTPSFRYGERAAQERPDDRPDRDALAAELDPSGLFR